MTNSSLQSKPHLTVLDGLRGIAALVVLFFHYTEAIYGEDYETNFIGHGFMAVDFFFILSGFVVAYAYDHRMKQIGMKRFFINRLIRLHPMVIIGTLVGLAFYLLNPYHNTLLEAGAGNITIATIGGVLMLPSVDLPYCWGSIFPFNSPQWSLLSEYFISIIYAIFLCRIGKKSLAFVGVACIAWFSYTAYQAGWINLGWDFKTMWGGFPRVCMTFISGMLIFRFNMIIKHKFSIWLPLLIMIIAFTFPHKDNDWITEIILIGAVLPLVVSIGAGCELKANTKLATVCNFLGRLSYPLYTTHISFMFLYSEYISQNTFSIIQKFSIAFVLMLVSVLFAYCIMKWIDEPVRSYLRGRN
ncbi:acyltransferase family protein [Saccharicrinis aurantiacus]|uniref:acyltransferase family protein n=1 Tax=Saccharicrinis aurantiacus TaxID=1849719 RepID=UPI000838290E|nr:acyltransferase [Saccharicrinis aurantiacus]